MTQVGITTPGNRALRRGRVSLAGGAYVVTTVTQARRPLFADWSRGRLLVAEMRRLHEAGWVNSLAFVVMPDHLHWLFVLGGERCMEEVIRRLKGRSARALNAAAGRTGRVWQPGFHDHGVRREEDLRVLARYVVANPLRAGLVERLADYPLWDAVWLDRGVSSEESL